MGYVEGRYIIPNPQSLVSVFSTQIPSLEILNLNSLCVYFIVSTHKKGGEIISGVTHPRFFPTDFWELGQELDRPKLQRSVFVMIPRITS